MSLRNLFGGGHGDSGSPDGAPDEWRPGTDEQGAATAGADRQAGVPAATGITSEPGLTTADVAAAAAAPAPAREMAAQDEDRPNQAANLDAPNGPTGASGANASNYGSNYGSNAESRSNVEPRSGSNPGTGVNASSPGAAPASVPAAGAVAAPAAPASASASAGANAAEANSARANAAPAGASARSAGINAAAASAPTPDGATNADRSAVSTGGAMETNGRETALFPADATEQYRGRWSDVQAGFVDEPRQAVQQADSLVAEVVQRLAQSFADERTRLEQQWDRGEDVSTEDLRQALRHYRSFFDRLLSL